MRELWGAVLAIGCATAAQAGGIDRSGQGLGALFETGSHAEPSFGVVSPSVSGIDVLTVPTGNVSDRYLSFGGAVKVELNDRLSFALIADTPFGADVEYATAASGGSVMLGGTRADTTINAVTGITRYKFTDQLSAHAGLRVQNASGDIALGGAAYGPLSGYAVTFGSDTGFGYVVGMAFERPKIALRVALSYNSAITHDLGTVESIAPGGSPDTAVSTPQSVNLEFQTGVAANTLVFGSNRWVDWSEFLISPAFFGAATGGASLTDLEDATTYTLGVGRKFSEAWSGAFSASHEAENGPLVSPLAPTNGRYGATLAAIHTSGDAKITVGITYTKLGDAMPETGTPDTARANFTGNSALGVWVKVGFKF